MGPVTIKSEPAPKQSTRYTWPRATRRYVTLAMALEAEEDARNDTLEHSLREAAEAREAAKKARASNGSPARPRKSVINLAMAFESGAVDDEKATSGVLNRSRESPVRPRKSVMNMAFELEALTFDNSEGQLDASESQAASSLTDDTGTSELGPLKARKSVANLTLPQDIEEEEGEHEEDMEPETEERRGLVNKQPAQRRNTAVNLAMAVEAEETARNEALERSRREAAEAREAARTRKARRARAERATKPETIRAEAENRNFPAQPRKPVMNLTMAFSTKKIEEGSPKDSDRAKACPVLSRKSVMNMALNLEALTFDESEGQLSSDTEKVKTSPKNIPIQARESAVNFSLSAEIEEEEVVVDLEPEEAMEPSTDNGLKRGHPAQRRITAINLAMALEEEEAARKEALERSRREAAEAREAARKARMAREGNKGLANERPAQRRSTAINMAMAADAEEAARKEALERSQREAAETRESHRPAQRRSTALNFVMAMEAEEAARKEALERSRREAAEARAAARRERQRRT